MDPAVTFSDIQRYVSEGRVRLCEVDSVHNLNLYHYSVDVSEENDPLLKQVRGTIVDNKTNEIVCRTFPFTPDYIVYPDPKARDQLKLLLEPSFTSFRFYTSIEGTIIRIFNKDSKWFVSTHKKINADDSRWGNQASFESQLRWALDTTIPENPYFKDYETFFTTLNPNLTYFLLLCPTKEGRIVSQPFVKPLVHFVGSFEGDTFMLPSESNMIPGLPYLVEHKFATLEEALDHVQNTSPVLSQGLVAMSPVLGFYKLTSAQYAYFYSLRGNQPNIGLRYIELIKDQGDVQNFVRLYPEFGKVFETIDATLSRVVKRIHNTYIRRFVKKEFAVLPPQEYEILKACHTKYMSDKQPITPQSVFNVLFSHPPLTIHKIVNYSQ